MDINVTLFGEIITFAVLMWVMMKYIWPPLTKALQDRQQKIAEGLQAAERAHRDLELAHQKIADELRDTKAQAAVIIEQANRQALSLIEESKTQAQTEGEKLLATAKNNIEQAITNAKSDLQKQTANLAILAAEKILQKNIDAATQKKLIDDLIAEI